MSETVYWGSKPQKDLAGFQKNQGNTNNCGEYAVASAINLLSGSPVITHQEVADLADRWTLVHALLTGGLYGLMAFRSRRLWKGGPTPPLHQSNLVKLVAKQVGLAVQTGLARGESTQELIALLKEPRTAVLVTLGWDGDDKPRIVYPDGGVRRLAVGDIIGDIDSPFAAHVMLLGAYDPAQADRSGKLKAEWGFINSWADGGEKLFWMPQEDFEKAWTFRIPFVKHNMVILRG